jgi:hypothetical protein
MSEKPITLTPAQLQELIAALKAPSQAELDKQTQAQREQQEVRRVSAQAVEREARAKQARQSSCNHRQGSRWTEQGTITQGESTASAAVVTRNGDNMANWFIVCQRCQRVWMASDPDFKKVLQETY